MGFDVDVERDHQAAFHVHLVDHVANLFEHPLVRHHHLLAERAAHLEQAKGRGPALGDGLFGPAVIAQQFDGLKGGKHEGVAPGREGRCVPFEVDHLFDGQRDGFPAAGGVLGKLPGLDQLALGVFDFDRNRVDADQFLDVLARLGEALEADGVAFHQELKNHVLDELRDVQPPGGLQCLLLEGLVIAGDFDLVAHGEGAPGVDAVLHQRLLDVVFPGLTGAFFPGGRNSLGGVDLAEGRRVERGRCGQRRDDKAGGVQAFGLFVLMGGAFHVILSVVSAMTAAHPARVGRTRLDAGYLPERGGKRRRMRSDEDRIGEHGFE